MPTRRATSLGTVVKRLRIEALLSQEQLAMRAGLSQWTISRLELDRHTPSELTLQRVARALGVTVADLIDGEAV